MFKSVTPKKILEFVEKELKNEIFRNNGDIRINVNELLKKAKKKRGEKVPLRKEQGIIIYSDWKFYDLGYNGTLYKMKVAVNNSGELIVTGFLDANSSFMILVSNVNWTEEEKEKIDILKKRGQIKIPNTYNYIDSIKAALFIREGLI